MANYNFIVYFTPYKFEGDDTNCYYNAIGYGFKWRYIHNIDPYEYYYDIVFRPSESIFMVPKAIGDWDCE